jgi:hypothetical protein
MPETGLRIRSGRAGILLLNIYGRSGLSHHWRIRVNGLHEAIPAIAETGTESQAQERDQAPSAMVVVTSSMGAVAIMVVSFIVVFPFILVLPPIIEPSIIAPIIEPSIIESSVIAPAIKCPCGAHRNQRQQACEA